MHSAEIADQAKVYLELAKPNALLEQIWNTLLRSVLPAHTLSRCKFGTLPSEELSPEHRRRQPLKPDLTPIIICCSIILGMSN